ncbi:MAG: DUF4382 domain-containing protein [Planctomycetaceae bacterium]|nr:DUF4382 domain-containing protein [Planctomycetaceae bacterium]
MLNRSTIVTSFLALAALFAPACGGGGGGGGGSATASTDLLITDAAVDELLSFQVKVQALQLIDDATGTPGTDVLDEDLTVDLIGAGVAPRWASRINLPTGTYRGVRATIDASSTVARDLSGAIVGVTHASTSFDIRFPAPVAISAGSYSQVLLDINLAESLSGSVSAPPLAFDPQGAARLASGAGATVGIDEIRGTVRSKTTSEFVIDAFADGDRLIPLGEINVSLAQAALLLDDDGLAFPSTNAFFTALVPNTTFVEVHGDLIGGAVVASRVEIEDGAQSYSVKIEGRIAALNTTTNTFDLVIVEIEKGSSIASPVLALLSNPISIAVDYDDATTPIVLEEHTPTSEASLADGQRVKCKFATFTAEPFRAIHIEIDGYPEFEGRITSIAGLPASFTMRLSSSDPAIGGSVSSSNTDITVDLANNGRLYLDTDGKPDLLVSQLVAGIKVEVKGTISGPSNGPTIAARSVKLHAGRLRGFVTAVYPQQGSIDVTMTDLDDPFATNVTLGNCNVDFATGCVFDDEAANATELYALFNGLQVGESLEVRVYGLGTSTANVIECHEIRAKVD